MSGRLQLPGDGAERGAKVSADQGERRNRRDRDQRGNQRILDRRYAFFVFDQPNDEQLCDRPPASFRIR